MNRYAGQNDDTLVELTLLGSEEAYAELVGRHEKAVMGTAYKITQNRYSAEDASQDAFVSAWMHLASLRDGTKFRPWVCSIAKNCARNVAMHYQNTIGTISLDLSRDTELTAQEEDELSALLSQSGERERDEQLRLAVDALSEKIRETMKLHYFEGYSVAEIAEKLSLPQGTVKWRLSEGRKQLRKEYGVMEKTYNENESMVVRVMRQVEELKLWALRNDKTGFEKDYRAVLAAVEALDDSAQKQYALADVLLRGYWWLTDEKNSELFERIRKNALESRNEDVLMSVAADEHDSMSGKEKIQYIRDTQIPFYEEQKLEKMLGYLWFWLSYYLLDEGAFDEAMAALDRVTEILVPSDVYYANALAAKYVNEKARTYGEENEERLHYSPCGEEYREIGGKLYFWQQPGYTRGYLDDREASLFWNMIMCGGLLFDPTMQKGDCRISDDGKVTLRYTQDDVTVETPAGVFEDCSVFVCEGERYGRMRHTETTFAPGVGIVRQLVRDNGEWHTWALSAYEIRGGEGLLPFCAGNRWDYVCTDQDDSILYDAEENRWEVLFCENGKIVVSQYDFFHASGYNTDSWAGNVLMARREYSREVNENEDELVAGAVEALERAVPLAERKKQKVHTPIALDVMKRIFETDPAYNPVYTEKGRWNFFGESRIKKDGGKISFYDDHTYSFEWKDMSSCGDEGYPVLYNFLYDMLGDAAGCVWSDEWVNGYTVSENREIYGDKVHLDLSVTGGETVVTTAGVFADCRRVSIDLAGLTGGRAYRGGKKDYWFASGVGIVKMRALYHDDTCEGNWELSAYEGEGEGYFPAEDGLFRRYEAVGLTKGWHGSVAYTIVEDNGDIVLFRNALGTQDRAYWEENQNQS